LTGEPLAELRSGGQREALRVLLVSREASVAVRRSGLNPLHRGSCGRQIELTNRGGGSDSGLRRMGQTVWSARRLARKLARVAVGIGPAVEPRRNDARSDPREH
jgi:hypothetical protein